MLNHLGKYFVAIALAVLKSLENYKDPTFLVLSSDHVFKNEESFLESINIGKQYSDKGFLVTFEQRRNPRILVMGILNQKID